MPQRAWDRIKGDYCTSSGEKAWRDSSKVLPLLAMGCTPPTRWAQEGVKLSPQERLEASWCQLQAEREREREWRRRRKTGAPHFFFFSAKAPVQQHKAQSQLRGHLFTGLHQYKYYRGLMLIHSLSPSPPHLTVTHSCCLPLVLTRSLPHAREICAIRLLTGDFTSHAHCISGRHCLNIGDS